MRVSALVIFTLVAALLLAATPLQSSANLLWGYPYAMFYDREAGSANYDTAFVYMFTQAGTYAGSAQIDALAAGGFFAKDIWHSMQRAMMYSKLVGIWNGPGPSAPINNGSNGPLTKFVITIF